MDACRLHSSVQYRPLDPPANRNDEWDGASLDVFSRPSVHPDPVRTGLNQGGERHENALYVSNDLGNHTVRPRVSCGVRGGAGKDV